MGGRFQNMMMKKGVVGTREVLVQIKLGTCENRKEKHEKVTSTNNDDGRVQSDTVCVRLKIKRSFMVMRE